MSVRLQTARLVIRPFEHGDADAWIAMFSDPEVRRFLPPAPVPTMETFERAIESRHAMEREIGYAMWAVDEMTTGRFIGQCGLGDIAVEKITGSRIPWPGFPPIEDGFWTEALIFPSGALAASSQRAPPRPRAARLGASRFRAVAALR